MQEFLALEALKKWHISAPDLRASARLNEQMPRACPVAS
jgi:hypothetical protein